MESIDLSTVGREELEQFAYEAINRMGGLEQSITALESQLQVDPDVIEGWRSWCETVEEERKKWSDMATNLEAKLRAEKRENARLFQAVKDLTVVLERIHNSAGRARGDKARMLDLKRAADSVYEQSGAAMADAYEEVLGYPEDLNSSELHKMARTDRNIQLGGPGYLPGPPDLEA